MSLLNIETKTIVFKMKMGGGGRWGVSHKDLKDFSV